MEVVKKTISLSNQPPLSETDLGQRAKDWQDEIEEIIPLDKVYQSFRRALALHTSSFPVNAFELIAAYKIVAEEDRVKAAEAEAENRLTNPVLFCKQKSQHVTEHGEVEIIDPFDHSQIILMPCSDCRPKARLDAIERHREKNKHLLVPAPLEQLESLVIKKADHLTIPETTLEIIAKAKDEVGREFLKNQSRIDLQEAHEKLTRIWHYCYQNNL